MKGFLSIAAFTFLAFAVCSCNCNSCGQKEKTKKTCCKEQTAEKTCCTQDSCCKKNRKIVITAYVEIKTDKVDSFVSGTAELIDKSRAEEGNLSYNLFADLKEKNKFVFVEEWKSQSAVDTHFATEHFKNFGTLLEEVSASPANIKVFAVDSEK
ncbi:MAG: antibiotic biosynthesis monooxygenase [Prevotellaceae bacterium]|jgi:quinol monooxygenase YgiN|nr:antibiotic biosynthesis monooxygenase [Prevotellaceae bacterium]